MRLRAAWESRNWFNVGLSVGPNAEHPRPESSPELYFKRVGIQGAAQRRRGFQPPAVPERREWREDGAEDGGDAENAESAEAHGALTCLGVEGKNLNYYLLARILGLGLGL